MCYIASVVFDILCSQRSARFKLSEIPLQYKETCKLLYDGIVCSNNESTVDIDLEINYSVYRIIQQICEKCDITEDEYIDFVECVQQTYGFFENLDFCTMKDLLNIKVYDEDYHGWITLLAHCLINDIQIHTSFYDEIPLDSQFCFDRSWANISNHEETYRDLIET